jgi:hypothetical protein
MADAGICVRAHGSLAELVFVSEEARAGYDRLTFGAADSGLSLYFVKHWMPVIRPKHAAIIAQLRAAARLHEQPSPTIGDLAAAVSLRESAVRAFIRWWQKPQESLEWHAVRAYIPEIQASPAGPYRFTILAGDALHPKHIASLQAPVPVVSSAAGSLEASHPEALSGVAAGSHQQGFGNRTPESPVKGFGNRTPAPPVPPMNPNLNLESGLELTSARAHACEGLKRRGFDERGAVRLLESHPDAVLWAERWLEWFSACGEINNPRAFLAAMIRRACDGDERARKAPWGYRRDVEPPKPAPLRRVRRAAERKPDRLSDPWASPFLQQALAALGPLDRGWLLQAEWTMDGPSLTLTVENTIVRDWLDRKVLPRLYETLPEFPRIRLVQKGRPA